MRKTSNGSCSTMPPEAEHGEDGKEQRDKRYRTNLWQELLFVPNDTLALGQD